MRGRCERVISVGMSRVMMCKANVLYETVGGMYADGPTLNECICKLKIPRINSALYYRIETPL